MNDKEKQIEEMANIICKETSNKGLCEKCGFKKHEQFGYTYQCHKFDDAQALYNAGYRKIDEGSVVLTEEEFSEFRQTIINLSQEHTKKCDEMNDKIIKARKETAKEICEMGENLYKMSYHKSNAMPRLVEWIKSNFGVEL